MQAVLSAIADDRRREILRLVQFEERSAGDIASHFDVSRPAISQHLTVLRTAGLVSERRDGNRRMYRANREALSEVREYIEEFWTDNLARLKAAAEKESNER